MNDFTKEELESLYYCYWHMRPKIEDAEIYQINLLNKLKSMIDNYCEHECNREIEIFVDTCRKCNSFLLREKVNNE